MLILRYFWSLSQVWSNLIITLPWYSFFLSFVLEVHWNFWISEFIISIISRKFFGLYFFKYVFCSLPFYRDCNYTYIKPLKLSYSSVMLCSSFISSFLFVFHLNSFYYYVFEFANLFFLQYLIFHYFNLVYFSSQTLKFYL